MLLLMLMLMFMLMLMLTSKKLYWLSISSPCYIVYMFHVGDISPVCQANIGVATCQLGWLPVQKPTQKTYSLV